MNKLIPTILLVITYIFCSCKGDTRKHISETNEKETLDTVFQIDETVFTKDFNTWYNYTYYNVPLSADFISLDTDSSIIKKEVFLNKLIQGNFVAFKIKVVEGRPVYKLYILNANKESIEPTVKQMAEWELQYLKMEGTEMPKYNFTDLNGNNYSNASTKGKIILFKCWFIHCTACVAEFPELNKLVEENKRDSDVLFISLAMDSAQNLKDFLKTKQFDYAVIPETRSFMFNKMHVFAFPTHLLIGKNGKILKVVNRIEELIPFLNKEKLKMQL